jgi:hypothetical protein
MTQEQLEQARIAFEKAKAERDGKENREQSLRRRLIASGEDY